MLSLDFSILTIKRILGLEGYYITTTGVVLSRWKTRGRKVGKGVEKYLSDTMRALKPHKDKRGYARVALYLDGVSKTYQVHRLVLETFIGPCPEGMECLHIDGNPENNDISNLRWGTHYENVQDAKRHGTYQRLTEAAAEKNRGKPRPQWIKDRISAANKGKKKSEEHKAKVRENHWTKREDAAEIRQKCVEGFRKWQEGEETLSDSESN